METSLSKQLILECVHQWGSSVAESILDPRCHIFSTPRVNGLIGYYTNRGCTVAFGDPVCSLADRDQLVDAFHTYCNKQKKNVIYRSCCGNDSARAMRRIPHACTSCRE